MFPGGQMCFFFFFFSRPYPPSPQLLSLISATGIFWKYGANAMLNKCTLTLCPLAMYTFSESLEWSCYFYTVLAIVLNPHHSLVCAQIDGLFLLFIVVLYSASTYHHQLVQLPFYNDIVCSCDSLLFCVPAPKPGLETLPPHHPYITCMHMVKIHSLSNDI